MTNFGEWSDRSGEKQTYFSGSLYGIKTCECGEMSPKKNNTCFKLPNVGSSNKCNCDQKDPVERHDAGYITNMVNL